MFGLSPHVHAMTTFFFFMLMNCCIKALGDDVPVSLELTARFYVGMVFFYPWVRRMGGYRAVLKTDNLHGHFIRTLFGASAVGGSFYALHFMPLSNVNALGQTYPFFLLLLSVPILGERVNLKQVMACSLGFAGVMVIAKPAGQMIIGPMLLIMAVALSAAASDLVVRRLARTDSNMTIMIWFFLIGGTASFLWWLVAGARVELGAREIALLGGAGILGALAQMSMTEAFRYLGAGIMGPYSFMGFFWATVMGWGIFGEAPELNVILGAMMIIAGAQMTYFFGKKLAQ